MLSLIGHHFPLQMIEEGYPVPMDGQLKEKYKKYVMTK